MAVSIQLQVNGGGYGTAGEHADAAASASIDARLTDVAGLSSIEWDIFGTHDPGASAPALTLSGNPQGEIASFTLAAGNGQAYGLRCRVRHTTGLYETVTTAVYVLYANGEAPVFVGETLERESTHGRTETVNDLIANLP